MRAIVSFLGYWVLPIYFMARGAYFGNRDGFITRAPAKVWALFWIPALATFVFNFCERRSPNGGCSLQWSFITIWIFLFSFIHGVAVYIFRKLQISEKINVWLKRQPEYKSWAAVDRFFGALVEMMTMLGLSYFFVLGLFSESEGPFLELADKFNTLIGEGLSSLFGSNGPDFLMGIADINHRHQADLGNLNCLNRPEGSYPYEWLGALIIPFSPLAVVVCFQPFLYSGLITDYLLEIRFYMSGRRGRCPSCKGNGVYVTTKLLAFGTLCEECNGKSTGIYAPDFTPIHLPMLLRSYLRFWVINLAIFYPAVLIVDYATHH